MSQWMIIAILLIVVIGIVVLMVAMLTELGTKHKTGAMKSTKKQHKNRKKSS